jgi:hypothetical protein
MEVVPVLETRREQLRRLSAAARVSREVYEDDQEARDAVIVLADREDWSLVAIAAETRLEPSHVGKILAREAAKRGSNDEGPTPMAPGPVDGEVRPA